MNWSVLAGSWKTTAAGILVAVCGGSELTGLLPEKYAAIVHAGCVAATAFGLIAAKDYNKTNAPMPTEQPKTLPMTGE